MTPELETIINLSLLVILYLLRAFFAIFGVLSKDVAFFAPFLKVRLSSLIGQAAANPPALWNASSPKSRECPVPKIYNCPPFLYESLIILALVIILFFSSFNILFKIELIFYK